MFGMKTYGRIVGGIERGGADIAARGLAGMTRHSGGAGSSAAHHGYNMVRKAGGFASRHPHATLYGGIGLGYSVAGKGGVLGWPGRHATSQPGGRINRGRDPRAPYSSGAAGLAAHSTGGYA